MSGNTHPYSGSHPVPKIQDIFGKHGEVLGPDIPENQQTDHSGSEHETTSNREEAGLSAKKVNQHPSPKDEVHERRKGKDEGKSHRREVTDPTTGKQITIEDVNDEFAVAARDSKVTVPNQNLEDNGMRVTSEDGPYTSATQFRPEYAENQDVTAPPDPVAPHTTTDVPLHGEKTNILFHPTPSLSLENTVFRDLEANATKVCTAIFTTIVVLGRIFTQGGLFGLLTIAAIVSSGVWYWAKRLLEESQNVDWETEKSRGKLASTNLIPESVEWVNSLLGLIWGLINPDMFQTVADTLEDVMQASVPGVIENVRVADISQGSNPLRILSLRSLPESEAGELKRGAMEARSQLEEQERKAEEEGGEIYNLECSFAYHAAPTKGRGVGNKARNMHLQVVFYVGIKGLFGIPLPIWVELKSLVGTVRLRLQLSPNPPFFKTLTFTLIGIPKVQAACVPMFEGSINVLNLPLISQFVNASIATAASEYVAPKSMSLEIGKMLVGDDIKKDTEALGVLWVRIKKAVGLSKQDKRGSSDPYITLAFSKYGKPVYSTRVIVDDLNPIWEESTGILVNAEHVKAGEALAVELWDSDRFTADDIVGKVEIPLQKLMLNPGQLHPQVSKLTGIESGSHMPGELHWECGFFSKTQFRPALRTTGKNINLPSELQDRSELQDEKGSLDTEVEDAVVCTPPDPLWPSGIISVIIHQIVNLELQDLKGTYGKRKNGKEYAPAKETGEIREEEGGKLPSSYCTIMLNDELVYRTRCKVVSSQPVFNAGTERFLRDWRQGMLTVTVRDQRYREHDPILGVVPLKVSDILQTSSQVTRWFPLDGGIGFGRIRLSVLFRSVETTLPPQLLGWDVGTFEFTSPTLTARGYTSGGKIKFRTGGSVGKLPKKNLTKLDNASGGTGIQWSLELGKKHPHRLRLPVKHRYMSPIAIDFYSSSNSATGRSSRHPEAYAMIWLNSLVDNEPTNIDVPIWKCSNPQRLSQNFITSPSDAPELELQEVGRLMFQGRFKAGTDEDHEKFAADNDSRETMETWRACKTEGVRSDSVEKDVGAVVKKLHKNSINEMRKDVGKEERGEFSEEDRERMTDKYGKDWSQIFAAVAAEFDSEKGDGNGVSTSEIDSGDQDYYGRGLSDDNDDDEDSDSDSDDSSTEYPSSNSDDFHHVVADNQSPIPGREAPTEESAKEKHGPLNTTREYLGNQKTMHRRQRGLMQWKPMRSIAFAKDEAKFGIRKLKGKISLKGREPDVETEV